MISSEGRTGLEDKPVVTALTRKYFVEGFVNGDAGKIRSGEGVLD